MITGLTVCVDYAGHLARGLDNWLAGLDRLVVVTSPEDGPTLALVRDEPQIILHETDAFYRDGATFNKGRAINEAVDAHLRPLNDWTLLFDADIVPPADWLNLVASAQPQPGTLYGAHRVQAEDGRLFPDADPAGYFLLFHGSDPNVQAAELVDGHWTHAGNYDSTFMWRWPRERRAWLPFTVTHHGEPGQNWWGVGNTDAMRQMQIERARRGGWQHERIG